MRTPTLDGSQNRLLAALSAADRRRLLADREPVGLVATDTLSEPGDRIRDVFFPIDCFISLIASIDRHSQLEVGLVGNEGMLGVSLILGVSHSPLLARVQGSGLAWRVGAATFRHELRRNPALRRSFNRYLYVSLSQLAQTAACAHFHLVEARLARWLLMARDRANSDSFRVTHDFLACTLGVRRAGVTRAAGALQRRDLIHYRRGSLEIRDLRGLEAAACSCYESAKEIHGRLFG